MKHHVIFVILGTGLWESSAGAQALPRFEAEIVGETVYALSGPGEHFYPTNRLFRDEKVIVHGTQVDKYLQIVPPAGRSFSWVRAEDLTERGDGLAVARRDGVKVFVGSELSPQARYVRQVTLNRDAVVTVVDKLVENQDGRSETWVKILPPADEIRYVLAENIRRPGPATLVPDLTKSPMISSEPGMLPANPANARPQPRELPPRVAFTRSDTIPPAIPISGLKLAEDAVTPVKSRRVQNIDPQFAADLDRMRNELTHLRDRLPESWNFAELDTRLRDLAARAPESEKAKVLELQETAKRMRSGAKRVEEYRNRWQQFLQQDKESEKQIQQLLGKSTSFRTKPVIEGTLRATKQLLSGRPAFELVDESNRPTHTLIAPPGLNLEKYINRRISVLGKQETLSALSKQPVIKVEQIAPVE